MTETTETFNVKIIAGFLGLKFLPRVIVIALNSINPKLTFSNERIEYRAFVLTGRLTYDEIESVDILLWTSTTNVYLIRKNSLVTVSANTNSEKELFNCLDYLRRKGCKLTKRADEFYLRQFDKNEVEVKTLGRRLK
jgi:hypothetical protein